MAATIPTNRVRVALDNILDENTDIVDVLTGQRIVMWQVGDVNLEFGVFTSPTVNGVVVKTIVSDFTNWTKISMALKPVDGLLGPAVVTKDVNSPFTATTQGQWDAQASQHGVFTLTQNDMNIPLVGSPQREFVIYFWATVGGLRLPLGKAQMFLKDSGFGDIGSLTILAAGARMSGGKLQILNQDDNLYYDFVFRTLNGVVTERIEGAGVP